MKRTLEVVHQDERRLPIPGRDSREWDNVQAELPSRILIPLWRYNVSWFKVKRSN